HGHPTPQALVESALYHASLLEKYDFDDIVLSMKATDVPSMIDAYRLASQSTAYPLHLGVTHPGVARMGLIKSAMGIGALLIEGIGDTIRVSLADDPVAEIRAAKDILMASGVSRDGATIIACPTCGRTSIDVIGLADQVEKALEDCKIPLTVAVMGCPVNGPGEAREADLGVSGGNGTGILFAKGKVLKKVPEDQILTALLDQIHILEKERAHA
ncbi:MAG: flavodoxin-dependent (E)-4-hydroxy-3-methylbut-2-enyl-diphosphate synthase, partial [Oscillospiraceae bacterium]|nr:flavodoxin-dependent (E)-4-hydroxy-3-methylbut-2-enyl-diphosphate synthase [Oscillospiraceae bacterium]